MNEKPKRVTLNDALAYGARVMPELFFDVLSGMPKPVQESTFVAIRTVEEKRRAVDTSDTPDS